MAQLRASLSISLDGFLTGPNPSEQHPLGEGGMQLHEWAFALAAWCRAREVIYNWTQALDEAKCEGRRLARRAGDMSNDDPMVLTALSAAHEEGRDNPWAISDAPASYVDGLLRAIVGFELTVTKLEGKYKLSQNRGPADRAGAMAGLRGAADPGSHAIADLMQARDHVTGC